jgi:dolichol-phosphate mannosyltransferase
MSATRFTISIVSPAFEEEEVLPRFHAELSAALATLGPEYDVEIIYVDDGSTDGTLEILRGLAAADPRVRYLSLSRNFGYQAALTAGLEHARGDAVVTLDSDLQHPPSVIPDLVRKWREGNDVVLTVREEDARQPWLRRLAAHGFAWLMRRLSDRRVPAPACDFRLLSRKAVDGLLRLRETHRFLRGLVSWVGYRTAVTPFRVAPRGAGSSKYDLRRLTGLSMDALFSFSRTPLRLMLGFGAAVMLAGLVVGVVGMLGGFSAWRLKPGAIAVLTSLHLIGGAILISLGLIGEYVGRVYEQVKGRPLYLLKESSAEAAAGAGGRPAAPAWPQQDKGAAA